MSNLKKLVPILCFLALVSFFYTAHASNVNIPNEPALFETSLSVPEATTDTSITLASATTSQGWSLTGYYCFTVDINQPNTEYECGTASSTNPSIITNLERGLDTQYGTTTISSLSTYHRRGADVRITDFPYLQRAQSILYGSSTFPNILSYSSTSTVATTSLQIPYASWVNNLVNSYIAIATSSLISSNNTWTGTNSFTNTLSASNGVSFSTALNMNGYAINNLLAPILSTDAANKAYVDSVATSGAPIANNVTTGIVRVASSTQISSGYSSTTSYDIPSSLASSTASTTTGVVVVASSTTDKIDPSFYDGTLSLFGGTSADSALTISSGTTTINLSNASSTIKNYSSISITGTGHLTFSNPSAYGSLIVLKSHGNVTLTCSTAPCIDVSGLGGNGAPSPTTSGQNTGASGNAGNNGISYSIFTTNGGGAGIYGGSDGSGGATITLGYNSTNVGEISAKYPRMFTGSGGGSGSCQTGAGSGSSTGGSGGNGGGTLVIEVGGALNFTTANGINASGNTGGNGSGTFSGVGGGGGGGAGGFVGIFYNKLTSSSGTITLTGGTGGTGTGSNAAGGGGSYVAGSNGSSTTGGNGANGFSMVVPNTEY